MAGGQGTGEGNDTIPAAQRDGWNGKELQVCKFRQSGVLAKVVPWSVITLVCDFCSLYQGVVQNNESEEETAFLFCFFNTKTISSTADKSG